MKLKLAIIILFILGMMGLLYYMVFHTTTGSKMASERAIYTFTDFEHLKSSRVEGNLESGIIFYNLELWDLKDLPEGSIVRVQELFIRLPGLNFNEIEVRAENARLRLPDSDPIVVSGTVKDKKIDVNIYSKGFTASEIYAYLPDFKQLAPIRGDVRDIDLYVTGDYLEPVIKGSFVISKFVYKGFILNNTPLQVDIQVKDILDDIKLFGQVNIEQGELQTKRVTVKLAKGSLYFSGLWNQPRIDLKGSSRIEKTSISIGLKGTVEDPQLSLSSEPSYSKEKLMIMLATGKGWQSVEDSINSGLNTTAVTKDFVDYFFFAGKSNQFAKRFGVSDFSVKLDQNHRGISAKKELSENLEIGYGVEQKESDAQSKDFSQKLEGEFKMSDKITIGVEREIKKKTSNELFEEPIIENNDKVMLKYKKSF